MTIDDETGEIVEDSRGLSARPVNAPDGNPLPKRSGHTSDVLRMLEDGEFDVEMSQKMRDLIHVMESHAHGNKGVAKGKLTITLDFALANGVFVLTPDFKVKEPVAKRAGTALFAAENGSLGRNPPGQAALFGVRPVRDDFERSEVRDI